MRTVRPSYDGLTLMDNGQPNMAVYHLLRQEQSYSNTNVGVRFFYFCVKGVAGFVVHTQKIEYTQTHYLK